MEPQIRYARTSDGVNIAWYSIGAGIPFIWVGPAFRDIEAQFRHSEMRDRLQGIAGMSVLTSYNTRGFGLSDRGVTDFSCEAMVRDLEAVADQASPGPFVCEADGYMAIPALLYAARHPDRVMALVLLEGIGRGADMSASWRTVVQLAREDWDAAVRMLARLSSGWDLTSTLDQIGAGIHASASRENFLAFSEAVDDWDASDFVSEVKSPALVTHYTSDVYPLEASRRLASTLPGGSFASIVRGPGESFYDAANRPTQRWLQRVLPRPEPSRTELPSGTAVILFTDIAESTALTERLGDEAFRAAARELDGRLRAVIREASGTPIEGKRLGDGLLATFSSARDALAAARRCVELSGESELRLHIGVHAGDIAREHGDIYGGAVNIAARICDLCEPGEILVSATVRDLARTSAGAAFEDRGEQQLKGIADPVRVFAVVSA